MNWGSSEMPHSVPWLEELTTGPHSPREALQDPPECP